MHFVVQPAQRSSVSNPSSTQCIHLNDTNLDDHCLKPLARYASFLDVQVDLRILPEYQGCCPAALVPITCRPSAVTLVPISCHPAALVPISCRPAALVPMT
jgi:hypothetical protein